MTGDRMLRVIALDDRGALDVHGSGCRSLLSTPLRTPMAATACRAAGVVITDRARFTFSRRTTRASGRNFSSVTPSWTGAVRGGVSCGTRAPVAAHSTCPRRDSTRVPSTRGARRIAASSSPVLRVASRPGESGSSARALSSCARVDACRPRARTTALPHPLAARVVLGRRSARGVRSRGQAFVVTRRA